MKSQKNIKSEVIVLKQDEDKINRRQLHTTYRIIITLLIIILIVTNLFDLIGLPHTRQLSRYEENLTSLKSPTSTYAIGSYSDLGHIYFNNGDHCDFVAGMMYETDHTREEIIEFYSGVTLPSIDGTDKVSIDLSFYDKKSRNGRLVYQIQTVEGSLKSGFDIRCI